jgi:ABC-2 type transport system ATP-binding protein
MNAAIDVHGLDKCFGDKHVVRDVSIQVEQGRITGFLGPNGAGKTTTLRLLCGLLTPDGGQGKVLGLDFRTQTDAIKRQTGYMTQRFSLYEDMTIQENLDFVARVHELDDRGRRVGDAIARLGLADRRGQLAGALSGGWKQRLALAAATLHDPKLLLLDEPTAGVDPKARREFWDEIHALADKGLTVLVSTHYMDEAERCHDIGYILDGRLIARGTAREIVEKSGLVTFNGEGEDIGRIVSELERQPGVLSATAFGAAVHVSGTDRAALERAIAPFRTDAFRWQAASPSLEDVFIQLMGDKPDDRYAA